MAERSRADDDSCATMKRIYIPKKETKLVPSQVILIAFLTFIFGCILSASIVLNIKVSSVDVQAQHSLHPAPLLTSTGAAAAVAELSGKTSRKVTVGEDGVAKSSDSRSNSGEEANDRAGAGDRIGEGGAGEGGGSILRDVRILVAIAAFDFAQIPHLEEVLDGYHDVCMAGASAVDVVIHATVAYPVTLIDLWNTRFPCENFSLTIVLKPKSIRLHLVDYHRTLFYDRIDRYDLFIYTEDDIKVSPTTVATYLYETKVVEGLVRDSGDHKPSDYNVGIVRYEYNYPANIIIDDNTRQATQNVTRVYWEHSGFERPVVPNAVYPIGEGPLSKRYISMKNHHQGMFLATRELLLAWKDRPKCKFDEVRDRPGKGSQPTEGTQRVWMSSQMLYGGRHCKVQQVLPKDSFGALTVLHLPNKNYRRVGKYRNRKFADGTEVFEAPHASLLSAMELHIGVQSVIPSKPQLPYRGIKMVDEVVAVRRGDRTPLLERRMSEYKAYVKRGGVLSEDDMTKTTLVEES